MQCVAAFVGLRTICNVTLHFSSSWLLTIEISIYLDVAESDIWQRHNPCEIITKCSFLRFKYCGSRVDENMSME